MSAIENLKVVLLDSEGNVSIQGSDEDKKIIKESLNEIEHQLELFVYEILRLQRKKKKKKPLGIETDICPICLDEKPIGDLHRNCGE